MQEESLALKVTVLKVTWVPLVLSDPGGPSTGLGPGVVGKL